MGQLDIRTFGDPVLRSPALPVVDFDDKLEALAADMRETMLAAPGVGLAAPQVGVPRRLFVFDSGEESGAYANPEIVWRSEETQEGEEGCLSIPGIYFPVVRALHVRVTARLVDGSPIEREAEGFLARIFQHEIDHLDGVLFVDRLDPERRREAMRTIREAELGLTQAPATDPARAL
ncbi:MAG TPA: peptide deformylase [Actinomycetota bacterium]|nr:peptide deformylase [Actinomycetota bacterium]